MKEDETRKAVREGYARIVRESGSCCASESSCCGSTGPARSSSMNAGYTDEELKAVPEGAGLGLGCGNPVAFASLREGDVVLDLGAGAGLDCFLASDRVGKHGRVIGVDMTPEMVDRARDNAKTGGYTNVEFRLGEIENLPVADNTADVVISNCVINLVPDKGRAFAETFRALKPGGRLMISDIVLLEELPDFIKDSIEAYIGCISGAILKDEYLEAVKSAGFEDVTIVDEALVPVELMINDPTAQTIIEKVGISFEEAKKLVPSVMSIKIHGVKPG